MKQGIIFKDTQGKEYGFNTGKNTTILTVIDDNKSTKLKAELKTFYPDGKPCKVENFVITRDMYEEVTKYSKDNELLRQIRKGVTHEA